MQADFHDKTTLDDEPFYIIRAGIRWVLLLSRG